MLQSMGTQRVRHDLATEQPQQSPRNSACACSVMSGSVTPWTVARQAPLSLGFSRQEYWSGLPFPSPGDLPDPGIKPTFPAWQVDSLSLSHLGSPIVFPRGLEFRQGAESTGNHCLPSPRSQVVYPHRSSRLVGTAAAS